MANDGYWSNFNYAKMTKGSTSNTPAKCKKLCEDDSCCTGKHAPYGHDHLRYAKG